MQRRQFIKFLSTTGIGMPLLGHTRSDVFSRSSQPISPVVMIPEKKQTWLGPELWANRLQDWRVKGGRIECLEGGASFEVRSAAIITRFLSKENERGGIRCKLGVLNPGRKGFAGFILGTGAGELDYRGAALVQRAPGKNGGLMAVVDDRGQLNLVDFSKSANPLAFTELKGQRKNGVIASPKAAEWELDCQFKVGVNGRFTVMLSLYDARTNKKLSSLTSGNMDPSFFIGGVSLVSSPNLGVEGARWWFSDIYTSGEKFQQYPERALSPVLGCLHSLNVQKDGRSVFKMTAQLLPLALSDEDLLVFEVLEPKSNSWKTKSSAGIQDGYVGLFNVKNWDATKKWPYRLRFKGQESVLYEGEIAKGIAEQTPLSIALISCILPTAKGLDLIDYKKLIPQEQDLGRYTSDNILFPHSTLIDNCESNAPDIYLFCGDQYYETYPTRAGRGTPNAKLDTLYRWYLWLWAFQDVLRNKPCLVLADDHDVLQGNLWGQGGLESGDNKEESGGFKWGKDLVRMIYRIQHSHNPDSYDDTPIAHDIPVSYGAFVYRGVDFAFVEDRKFKSPPNYTANPLTASGELLGSRQEAFLADWADKQIGLPKVCVAASMWGSPQTDSDGSALLDYDSNGYPHDGRDRAVRLVAKAKALVLAGDQHLGMVAHQGLESHDDGALFFAGPAAAAFWQRWFEASGRLENQRNGNPNTGDFTDTFGNKMRVLAVANPKISHAEFNSSTESWGKFVADHRLKSEGYGIIRVDTQKQQFLLECWPASVDPVKGKQFDGWPVSHPISNLVVNKND